MEEVEIKDKTLKNLSYTGLILFILLILLFAEYYFLKTFLEAEYYLSVAIFSFFLAYIIFSQLTLKNRVEISVAKKIKWLSTSREQFRRLYESAPVPYLVIDKKGKIKDMNNSGLRFWGSVKDEIFEKDFFSFVIENEESKNKKEDLLFKFKNNIPFEKLEFQIMAKDQEIRWVLISIFYFQKPFERENNGLVTLFDITDQKQVEKTKTEFLSLASHQLRSPMATIKWYVNAVLTGQHDLDPKAREYLSLMSTVNDNMIETVNILLNISRIEMGILKPENQNVNLQSVCDDILNEFIPQFETKKLDLIKEYGNFFINIQIDPKLFGIVFHNLISNAIKYTDKGHIKVRFFQDSVLKYIEVEDTGLGIPKNEQNKIFSKTFRASNVSNVNQGQSTGLGLFLVKSLLEIMNAEITFTSEEGKGTIFRINLN